MAEGEPSYIDYEAFLDPGFSPASFANTLVTSTNNATDTPLDLSTPLSRVLFDLQEIDTHIHALTTRSALPLLSHTQSQTAAADRILKESGTQIASVTQGYERLQKEVIQKWEAANEARIAAENSLATVRLARAAARCLTLGRQLESQVSEITGRGATGPALSAGSDGATSPSTGKEGFRALERAAYTILSLREMFSATAEGEEGYGLDRVKVIRTLRGEFVIPAENLIKSRAQQAINKFSLSSTSSSAGQSSVTSGYKQARDARARLATAATTLYLLSPPPKADITAANYKPELLLSTLQGFMHTAIMTSVNTLSRALTQLPLMDRTLADISARCQDIVALETILRNLRPPSHPLLISTTTTDGPAAEPQPASSNNLNLLQPLFQALDTSSLPSYYWRSLASSLSPRVQEIINRGGVSARSLRSNRDRLRVEIKECVLRASQISATSLPAEKGRSGTETVVVGNWEREAAVMVSSVVGPLGR
ncbi:Conserved oligomeric Golgi complex subunit 5 [Penicillium bovifimosum]|uniref:Conserved oligomeric Golgi complex subunit 5 n=1 Tax=Penicillium bovifimosum TaxID=126998 RepID=A0A9W9GWH1_9EURO|nr:Conserved oligomeric Golgi complex subunit 5 [Penicillium bovifimosum]KAJ5130631.1 Conserved oligomeric Golgi complex subunit 5 [Penicillium bovifimosum]